MTLYKRHHTLIQNLKAMGLWVSSLIYSMSLPFLVNVGHKHSHLISNNLPLKCGSPTSLVWSTQGSYSHSPIEPNQGFDTSFLGSLRSSGSGNGFMGLLSYIFNVFSISSWCGT